MNKICSITVRFIAGVIITGIIYLLSIGTGIISMYVINGPNNYDFTSGYCNGPWFCIQSTNEAICSAFNMKYLFSICPIAGVVCLNVILVGLALIMIFIGIVYLICYICKYLLMSCIQFGTNIKIYERINDNEV